jgi:hypothetical protein
MYQYTTSGKIYGDMPPPIGEHAIIRNVGGNANGSKHYPKYAGMISMSNNLRGLQAGSGSIGETNVEWQKYEWREITYQTLRTTFGDAKVEFSTSEAKFEGRYKPWGPPLRLWALGHTVWLMWGAMPPVADGGATSLTEGKEARD